MVHYDGVMEDIIGDIQVRETGIIERVWALWSDDPGQSYGLYKWFN